MSVELIPEEPFVEQAQEEPDPKTTSNPGSKKFSKVWSGTGSKKGSTSAPAPPPASTPAPAPAPGSASVNIASEVLRTEFIYYSTVLRTYAVGLSRDYDKTTVHLWMKKLFGPEYYSTVLMPKRNKYLVYLSVTILNDEAYGIFREEPPCLKLPEIKDIPFNKDEIPPAAWEIDTQWVDTIEDLPDDLKMTNCYVHENNCPSPPAAHASVLDSEFQFFLWLSKPYVALLPDPDEKTMAACWIQVLCGIAPEAKNCIDMKIIRNDYMKALLGYVHDLRVEGPFRMMPSVGPLPPLSEWYEDCKEEAEEFGSPSEKQAEKFLAAQPIPESGAFAYINVTGELFGDV